MADKYELEVALKKGEVARYNFYHIRWLIILDIIGIGVFLYLVVGSFFHPDPEIREMLGTISIWVAVVLAFGLSQPLIIILQVYIFRAKAIGGLMAKRNYIFSDSGIHISLMGKKAEKRWADIRKIINTGNLMLIFTAPKLAYIIPRRSFKNGIEWSEFRKFLSEHI